MADTVTATVVATTPKQYIVHLTNVSDGTGESAISKVVKSTLRTAANVAPSLLAIERIRWAIQGFQYVKLAFAHTAPDTALLLSGNGFDDFRGLPDDLRDFESLGGIIDPASAGGTGDITLTTVGAVSGYTYDLTLWVRLIP